MTTDYVWIYPHRTTEATIRKIREIAPASEFIYYLYVLDKDDHLLGALSLRTLLLALPTAFIERIMETDLVTVAPDTPAVDVASTIAQVRSAGGSGRRRRAARCSASSRSTTRSTPSCPTTSPRNCRTCARGIIRTPRRREAGGDRRVRRGPRAHHRIRGRPQSARRASRARTGGGVLLEDAQWRHARGRGIAARSRRARAASSNPARPGKAQRVTSGDAHVGWLSLFGTNSTPMRRTAACGSPPPRSASNSRATVGARATKGDLLERAARRSFQRRRVRRARRPPRTASRSRRNTASSCSKPRRRRATPCVDRAELRALARDAFRGGEGELGFVRARSNRSSSSCRRRARSTRATQRRRLGCCRARPRGEKSQLRISGGVGTVETLARCSAAARRRGRRWRSGGASSAAGTSRRTTSSARTRCSTKAPTSRACAPLPPRCSRRCAPTTQSTKPSSNERSALFRSSGRTSRPHRER